MRLPLIILATLLVGCAHSERESEVSEAELATAPESSLSVKERRFASYFRKVRAKIEPAWKAEVARRQGELPPFEPGGPLVMKRAIVSVRIGSRGEVHYVGVATPSRIAALNEAATRAVRAAAPFDPPPRDLLDEQGFVEVFWDLVLEL